MRRKQHAQSIYLHSTIQLPPIHLVSRFLLIHILWRKQANLEIKWFKVRIKKIKKSENMCLHAFNF